ncbi:hypothetical protein Tco_0871054 [Tanacetum coccineum]
MGTTDIGVFGVSGILTILMRLPVMKMIHQKDNVELYPLSSSLLYVRGNSSSRNDSLSGQLDFSESRSTGSSNEMGRTDIGVSRVHTNDDDVGETSHYTNATSKRQHVCSHPYNVESCIFSSRPPYVGDNSSRPTDNFSGQPDRSGSN